MTWLRPSGGRDRSPRVLWLAGKVWETEGGDSVGASGGLAGGLEEITTAAMTSGEGSEGN